jgi:hypothetical protein
VLRQQDYSKTGRESQILRGRTAEPRRLVDMHKGRSRHRPPARSTRTMTTDHDGWMRLPRAAPDQAQLLSLRPPPFPASRPPHFHSTPSPTPHHSIAPLPHPNPLQSDPVHPSPHPRHPTPTRRSASRRTLPSPIVSRSRARSPRIRPLHIHFHVMVVSPSSRFSLLRLYLSADASLY